MQSFGLKMRSLVCARNAILSIRQSPIQVCGGQGADITYRRSTVLRLFGSDINIQNRVPMASKKYMPYYASGKVVSGFGRGSKSLGCPTANFPEEVVEALPAEFETGIYYGWASLNKVIYKMVMSIGWNPFYNNDKKSMEIHLLHNFEKDFYGEELKVIVLGYIRPEMNFSSVDELIDAIKSDISIANKSLEEPNTIKYKEDPFLHS